MLAERNIKGDDLSYVGLKKPVRCLECGQFHLREGYCQARNPVATAIIGRISAGERVPKAERKAAAKGIGGLIDDKSDVTLSEDVSQVSVTDDALSVTESEVSVTPDKLSVTCAECGSEFEPKRSTAKYCSAACRVKASRHE